MASTKEKLVFYKAAAVEDGALVLKMSRECLERAVEEMKRYEEGYLSDKDLGKKAKRLNWAINYLASMLGNVRMDLLADRQAELVKFAALEKELADASTV